MKKAMAILLAAVLALACTACGGSKNGETKDRLAQIKEKGYIELCTEPYFAPYEYVDPNKSGEDQYQGMDIEVARYIADKLGVDLKITALDFTAVLAGVADGKYDFAISAIAYAPSRAEAMRLSDVYYSSNTGYGFIVRTEDIDKYNDLDSLKDAVVITQSGSVQEALYNQYINGACKEFKLVANMTDGYLAVAEGKADVCICSTASAQLYADANGGMSIPDYRFEVDPNMNGTCVAMPMEGTESLAELEKVIKVWLKYYPVYLSGLWGTLWISAVTVFLGALLGMVVALMRMSRLKILRTAFNVYVEILRGTPILLQLYFFWIGLPKLVPFELTDTQCIVAALVVNASAFISEIIRAGIGAVDKGQWEAARSIGLSETHVMTRIILPQAVKNILPALCNEFISTVKGTSLASVFFVGELMTSFKTVQSATFLALQSLTIVGIIYFLLNFILSRLLRVIERRLTVSD